MLKESNNLIAEILLKTLGKQYFSTTGTWSNGIEAVKQILASTGVDFNKIQIADGAGLSRYNFISPRQFLSLLDYAYYRFSEKDDFYQALPIGHVDGTLKNRFRVQDINKVHAKTGSMVGGISSLTGYINTNQQHTLAFVILINNFCPNDRNKKVDAFEDRIVEYLIENE